jgi:hypothetical protein
MLMIFSVIGRLFDDGKTISRRNICQGLLKDYVSLNNEDEMLFYTIQSIFPISPPVCATTIYSGGSLTIKIISRVYFVMQSSHFHNFRRRHEAHKKLRLKKVCICPG